MSNGAESQNLTVITTHVNADFDAMASMVAAQKLYPEARVVFPGSQEKNLRNFFINSMVYLLNMVDIKAIEVASIRRLVLVDTKQAGRIGKLAEALSNPGLTVHIFDHHPPAEGDIRGDYTVQRNTGANVTILTDLLRERGIEISPDEATVMCLGIYEDTGSFSFNSTTADDFRAAAFLVSCGANVNMIANLIAREITADQVGLLNDMIQSAARYNIQGVEVVVTLVSTDNYVPDFAYLVQKMAKMEDLAAIFAIGRMGSKIYVVARSKTTEVDVGAVVSPLGGGGHTYAAAATVRDLTLAQTEQQLVRLLYENIRPRRRARDLMSAPPITVAAQVSCHDAAELLTRYNINVLLVVENPDGRPRLSGFISRQVIEKAMHHDLGGLPVGDYMTTDPATVEVEADLTEIQDKIISNKQRILPVMEGPILRGVLTRTDLLNVLVSRDRKTAGDHFDPLHEPVQPRTKNVVKFMRERLTARLLGTLKAIGETAEALGCGAYVVGGFVRDLFLYRPNEDLDVVVEGDGIAFAKRYAAQVGARIHSHAKFGTAVIISRDGFNIDVASARLEYYKFPAALPTVEMSSIKLDLYRRDFTVNTLAIQLNPKRFGMLIDFFSAQRDIKGKAIRVLHNLSFVEDPTRVFRAIRFEQRFDFTIGKLTAGLIENAVRMNFFSRLSGRRVFQELRLLLEEENPVPAVQRLNDFDLLPVIHPSVTLERGLIPLLNSVKKVISWYDLLFLEESYMRWAVYLAALTRSCDRGTVVEICTRFELAPRYRAILQDERFEADRCLYWLERRQPVINSTLYHRLSVFRTEMVLYMMAATSNGEVKRAISHYFTKLRYVGRTVTGRDLIGRGFTPGPDFKPVLEAAHSGRLNGYLRSRQQELEFAVELAGLRQKKPAKAAIGP